ncbi:MAG: hypothetical protein WC477_00680 [Patescibacteria group bacterium]
MNLKERAPLIADLVGRLMKKLMDRKANEDNITKIAAHQALLPWLSDPDMEYIAVSLRVIESGSISLIDVCERLGVDITRILSLLRTYSPKTQESTRIRSMSLVAIGHDVNLEEFKIGLRRNRRQLGTSQDLAHFMNVHSAKISEPEILAFDDLPPKKAGGEPRCIIYIVNRRDGTLRLRVKPLNSLRQKKREAQITTTRFVLVIPD